MSDDGSTGQTKEGKLLGGVTGKGFMPGQSGNPKGRPRGSGITDRLRAIVEADGGKLREILVKVGLRAAADGDFRFWKEIYDRLDGPLKQQLDVEQYSTMFIAIFPAEPPPNWHEEIRELIGYQPGDPLLPGDSEKYMRAIQNRSRDRDTTGDEDASAVSSATP